MLRLWICLRLPSLPLEVFRPSWSTELPMAVLESEKVCAMTPMAARAGVRPGMRRGGVLTMAPQTLVYDRAPEKEAEGLRRAAIALLQFSPSVVEAEEACVLVDVSASLRLFGGIRKLVRRVRETAQALGMTPVIGCAPTAQGAWLLACVGGGRALSHHSLERQVTGLPAAALPAARPYLEWLDGLGCRTLGDLRRLPRAGLQRRCGKELNEALDRALGLAPEIFEWLEAPPSFTARVDLPDRIEHAEATLLYARGLIVQMLGWLAAHQLAVTKIVVELQHERGRAAVLPTIVEISLAEPSWSEDHLMRLLRERLARVQVEAPMIAVRLSVTDVQPKDPPSEELFPEPGGTPEDHARVMELLAARLGAENILRPAMRADYRPEVANGWEPAVGKPRAAPHAPNLPRPAWLLDKPVALIEKEHRPFYGSPLRLVSPPERIEAGWWAGELVTRDYYVAEGRDHTFYWIYAERMTSPEGKSAWFLHGLFA
ncbi:DNA polymerase Y family protein (plasmid) [Cupriavidus pinatubonensis]|uniref:Y-family DNA polymerase n=1 Tax=Cupriavidus pinatubonensis TaxID=248026 RepID=UPI001C73DF72|nr:DNA polymerase Y family protein [Cupriavidus pinatubonensis]QYY33604.1 DNA polymerase Y family protein [Cupriavidus pinatubonensis]